MRSDRTCCELQPGADLVDGGGTAESKEAETDHAGPHGPQGHAYQDRHGLEGRQRGQAGQTAAAVWNRPVRLQTHLMM